MGLTTEQYEKIIRFLDAGMEPDEMDEFEREMAANPEMRHQLDFEQSVRDGFALRNITKLAGIVSANDPANGNEVVQQKPGEVKSMQPGKVKSMRRWMAISAALIAACLVLVFALVWHKAVKNPDTADKKDISPKSSSQSQPTAGTPPNDAPNNASNNASKNNPSNAPNNDPRNAPNDTSKGIDNNKGIDMAVLFTQNFKKDALPDPYPVFLAEALTDYEAGNYTTLQKLNLKDLPETRGVNEVGSKENILKWGHYFRGLAFLETGNGREAAINLVWVLKNQPGRALRAKTQWYLALAYLKGGEGEKATELFKRVVEDNENQELIEKAEKILNALKN